MIAEPLFLLQRDFYSILLNFFSWQLSPDPNFLLKHMASRTFPCLPLGLLTVFCTNKKLEACSLCWHSQQGTAGTFVNDSIKSQLCSGAEIPTAQRVSASAANGITWMGF